MAAYKHLAAVILLLTIVDTEFVQCTDHEITYVQPERFIKCDSKDEICEIQLTISTMLTLTAYTTSNGTRGNSGYEVTVNEQGGFDFLPRDSPIKETELFQPIVAEGTTRRNLLVINDQVPGPTLIGYKNQRVRITVINNLPKEAITLHWHGQHVNGSAGQSNQYMDGVPYITQCPILPSNSFVYDFYLFPGGTYWYHSHQFDERSNGMYGGLIILDPDVDSGSLGYQDLPEQHTIALFEWFPVNSDEYIESPLSLPDPVNASKTYSSVPTNDGQEASFVPFFAGLMNYAGWRYTPAAADCRRVANTTLPYFNVSQRESYRFRLIGSQVTYAYRFSIHNHTLRVVATDGFDATVPNATAPNGLVDFIIVHVGERYDFILEASQPVDNYLMLVETLEVPSVLMERGYCIKAHRVYSVLHYNGASDTLPSDFDDSYDPLTRCSDTQCYALNCPFQNYPIGSNIQCINVAQLELSTPEPVPNNDVNPSAFLNFGFGRGSPSVNDRRFEFPPSPPLSQLADIDPDLFCQYSTFQSTIQEGIPGTDGATSPPVVPQPPFTCAHTYTVDTDTVEMVYTNIGASGGSAHPIHLHGHHYRVMNIGYPTYNEDGTFNSSTSDITCTPGGACNIGVSWASGNATPSACEMNGTCPMKDTVTVPFGGYVRIRFPSNNWGWWIMHCHIEPHLLGGMAMVVNETSVSGFVPPPTDFPMCGNFDDSESVMPSTIATLPSPTSSPAPRLIEPSEAEAFKNATIALAVILFILLAALIVAIGVIIILCVGKGKKIVSPKVEIELK